MSSLCCEQLWFFAAPTNGIHTQLVSILMDIETISQATRPSNTASEAPGQAFTLLGQSDACSLAPTTSSRVPDLPVRTGHCSVEADTLHTMIYVIVGWFAVSCENTTRVRIKLGVHGSGSVAVLPYESIARVRVSSALQTANSVAISSCRLRAAFDSCCTSFLMVLAVSTV